MFTAGRKYHRWTVVKEAGKNKFNQRVLECVCDCGTVRNLTPTVLKYGKSMSCGCLRDEVAKKQHRKHGHENERGKTRTYTTWDNMIQRCTNPKRQEYKYYGGRGITVCEAWRDFMTFYADMGERPEERSLDRIDYNGNYEPSNCRWATRAEQHANRRPRSKK